MDLLTPFNYILFRDHIYYVIQNVKDVFLSLLVISNIAILIVICLAVVTQTQEDHIPQRGGDGDCCLMLLRVTTSTLQNKDISQQQKGS